MGLESQSTMGEVTLGKRLQKRQGGPERQVTLLLSLLVVGLVLEHRQGFHLSYILSSPRSLIREFIHSTSLRCAFCASSPTRRNSRESLRRVVSRAYWGSLLQGAHLLVSESGPYGHWSGKKMRTTSWSPGFVEKVGRRWQELPKG